MPDDPVSGDPGLWALLMQVDEKYGPVLLVFLFIILFLSWIIYSLIWRVWSSSMKAKDDEIERLVDERNTYQSLFFERLKSSTLDAEPAKKIEDQSGENDTDADRDEDT